MAVKTSSHADTEARTLHAEARTLHAGSMQNSVVRAFRNFAGRFGICLPKEHAWALWMFFSLADVARPVNYSVANGEAMKRISTANVLLGLFPFLIASAPAQNSATRWVGSWAASPMDNAVNPGQPSPANSTYRNIVHLSAGGAQVRVELTNEFGSRPLTIAAAHVALSAELGPGSGLGAIQRESDHALTFSGRASVTIPSGTFVISDPVAMAVAPLADVAVSLFLPHQSIGDTTCHDDGQSTNYIAAGDATAAVTLSGASTIGSWCFVKGIEVSADPDKAAAVVTLGDSITDGARSSMNTNHRWPDVLAARLQADKKMAHLSVLNEGISGNRVLHDRAGPNALSRFDRDVLALNGVKFLIILEGINDIGAIAEPRDPADVITAQDLIFGYSQLISRAHEHGIKVFGATLTPYKGAGYFSDAGEKIRQDVNEWIRNGGAFDGVIDFDQVTRDAANPAVFSAQADSGDHLHPGDAGYKAMGEAIDLALFR
jgi:lysophospholipase L1-like esterase